MMFRYNSRCNMPRTYVMKSIPIKDCSAAREEDLGNSGERLQNAGNEKDLNYDSPGGNGKQTTAGREMLENKQFGVLKKDKDKEKM